MNGNHKLNGLTLLELMIVVVIIGVLAGISYPTYTGIREHALGREAIANLKLIAAAERVYRLEDVNGAYVDCECNAGNCNSLGIGCNEKLRLSLSPQNWSYEVEDATETTFTATATREVSGTDVCVYTLTQSTPKGEPVPNNKNWCP